MSTPADLRHVLETERRASRRGCAPLAGRLGIIAPKPMDRYRLELDRILRCLPHGPVPDFIRRCALGDAFAGRFDGTGLLPAHGSTSRAAAPLFFERMQRRAQDSAHPSDRRVPAKEGAGYALRPALCSGACGTPARSRR